MILALGFRPFRLSRRVRTAAMALDQAHHPTGRHYLLSVRSVGQARPAAGSSLPLRQMRRSGTPIGRFPLALRMGTAIAFRRGEVEETRLLLTPALPRWLLMAPAGSYLLSRLPIRSARLIATLRDYHRAPVSRRSPACSATAARAETRSRRDNIVQMVQTPRLSTSKCRRSNVPRRERRKRMNASGNDITWNLNRGRHRAGCPSRSFAANLNPTTKLLTMLCRQSLHDRNFCSPCPLYCNTFRIPNALMIRNELQLG